MCQIIKDIKTEVYTGKMNFSIKELDYFIFSSNRMGQEDENVHVTKDLSVMQT